MSFVPFAKPTVADTYRLRAPAFNAAQIVRAVLVGLLFAFVFLWALPHSHILLA
jgi:hypothetical protein